jgi:hypothetical protein
VPGFLLEERFLVKGKDFPEGWQQVPVVLVVFPPEGKEAVMLPRQERFPVGEKESVGFPLQQDFPVREREFPEALP